MLIVSPNLGLDRVLRIPDLRPGEVLRFTESTLTAGGKGVNVARVAKVLGVPALLVGFAPGHCGQAVAGLLADEGLAFQGVPAAGEARSMAIITEDSGRVTVLNEPGSAITQGQWEGLENAVRESLPGHQVVVCIGSVPPGSPADGYARLVRLAHDRGAAALVDANGALLANALAAHPDVVTPNVFEAKGVLEGAHQGTAELVQARPVEETRQQATVAAVGLVSRGARAAVVTAGAAGAALAETAEGGRCWWIAAPDVRAHNPIGAGDAFAAGLAIALEPGEALHQAVRLATAAAAASVETAMPGQVDAARVRELVGQVRVTAG